MDLMLNISIPKPADEISHHHKILSVGSCFTEHIGNALKDLKFHVLQNPNGILFDPASVCKSLNSYITNTQYHENDLFSLNELWHCWDHHSRFSGTDKELVLTNINRSQTKAHTFLKEADWLIITLGSSFSYHLTQNAAQTSGSISDKGVANCHRAPAQWFSKHMMTIDETTSALRQTLTNLLQFNPTLRFIFTISPVRHIRDGVVENNRSKARLLEAVHSVVSSTDGAYYFPSYELVIDLLRDYRFYAEDLVHPNYLATGYVLERFIETFMSTDTQQAIKEIAKLNIARKHKSSHPTTDAHRCFLQSHAEKAQQLQQQYPHIDFTEDLAYFSILS